MFILIFKAFYAYFTCNVFVIFVSTLLKVESNQFKGISKNKLLFPPMTLEKCKL